MGPISKGREGERGRCRGREREWEGKRRGSEGTTKEGRGGFSPQYFGL